MKTFKALMLVALAAFVVVALYSCGSDKDDDATPKKEEYIYHVKWALHIQDFGMKMTEAQLTAINTYFMNLGGSVLASNDAEAQEKVEALASTAKAHAVAEGWEHFGGTIKVSYTITRISGEVVCTDDAFTITPAASNG